MSVCIMEVSLYYRSRVYQMLVSFVPSKLSLTERGSYCKGVPEERFSDEYSGFNGTMCLPGLHCTVAVNVDHPLCDAPL